MTFLLNDIIDESFGFNPASLEKFYKSLMTKTKYPCTLNRIDQNKDYIGAYYRGDCNCQRLLYDKMSSDLGLKMKLKI